MEVGIISLVRRKCIIYEHYELALAETTCSHACFIYLYDNISIISYILPDESSSSYFIHIYCKSWRRVMYFHVCKRKSVPPRSFDDPRFMSAVHSLNTYMYILHRVSYIMLFIHHLFTFNWIRKSIIVLASSVLLHAMCVFSHQKSIFLEIRMILSLS